MSMRQGAFCVPLEAHPLPIAIKRKWAEAKDAETRSASLENIEFKLQAAEQRREDFLSARRTKTSRSPPPPQTTPSHDVLKRLEERLASAELKRQAVLARIKARAALVSQRAVRAAEAEAARRQQLEEKLNNVQRTAEAARLARLAETAARAARLSRRCAPKQQPSDTKTPSRQGGRLARAGSGGMVSRGRPTLPQRHSKEAARAASPVAASGTAPSDASAQHSQHAHQACDVPQACLEASARKIQQHWMAFKAKHRPTAALVQAFIATGIPFSVALPPCPEGYDPTNDLRNEERVSMLRVLRPAPSSPTPLSTPEPCSSPTSTLRTLRGVGDGREAPSNTPAGGTPTDTPRAGAEGVQRGQAVEAAQAVQIPPMVGDHAMLHASRPRSESTQGMGDMGNRAVGHGGMQTGVAPRPLFLHSATPKREGAASFDEFAAAMSAPASLRAAQALLRRLHARAAAAGKLTPGCERLLQSLTPGSAKTGKVLDRYPVRAFLCSYMILGHPEVVLSHRGQREGALSSAAADMLAVFETLLQRLEPDNLRPGAQQDQHLMHGGYPGSKSVPQLLEVFDLCWVAYLEQFLAWKSHDAAGLEADLIRAAVELETSRLAKMAAAAARVRSQKDLDALVAGVDHDLSLIEERVIRLTGASGASRLHAALAAARAAAPPQATAPPSASSEPASPTMGTAEGRNHEPEATDSSPEAPSSPEVMAPSPQNSPAKKVQRRAGQYNGGTTPPTPQPAAPGAAQPGTQEDSSSDSGNLALMWHLLYDPTWRLPTAALERAWTDALGATNPMTEPPPSPEDLAAMDPGAAIEAMQSRVRRIAERAFWDAVAHDLSSCEPEKRGAGAKRVASLLADAGHSLLEVLPGGSTAAADVAGHLGSPEALEAALLDPGNGTADGPLPGINCGALFGLLEWSSALIQRMGAPAREAKAAAAQAGVRRDLLAATAPADAAAVVARALRLLSVLLSLLRLDVANAHLAALVARLGAEGSGAPGVAYARLKLAHEGHLGPVDCETSAGELAERLPHTRAWLALASGRLPQLESLFTAGTAQPKRTPTSSSGVAVQSSKSSAGGVPGSLRTGKASLTAAGPSGSSASALAALSAPKLELPVAVRSWRALVRCGLVQLVVGDGAVTSLALPETLKADAGRLFAAQNEFQRALVLAACLATAQQLPGSELSSHHGPASHERAERAKRRLKAVLAAQDVVLADIVAEVAALVCPIEPPSAQLEQSTQSMLRDMLSKNSPGMRALTAGLRDALVAHMLQGPEEGARHVADAALAAVGAGALRAEVEALAASLGRIAAVSEAVCEPWYCLLSSDLFT